MTDIAPCFCSLFRITLLFGFGGGTMRDHHWPRVHLLGTPFLRLTGARGQKLRLPDKVTLILALLAVEKQHTLSRRDVATRLWESADSAKAATNLRQVLARLRRFEAEIGITLIQADTYLLKLPSTRLETDLQDFLRLDAIADAIQLNGLLAIYRGELLEGVSVESGDLSLWVETERTNLRQRFVDLVVAGAARVGGLIAEAALLRALDHVPYDEAVWRALIEMQTRVRGIGAAKQSYERLRAVLAESLHVEPALETRVLAIKLFGQAWVPEPATPFTAALPVQPPMPRVPAKVPRLSVLMPVAARAVPRNAVQAFAAMVVEDVTLALCRLRSLAVIAPHSAWQFSQADTASLPTDYAIDYLVKTRFSDGPNIAFSGEPTLEIEIFETETWRMLWGERMRFRIEDTPARYRDMVAGIARVLADTVERVEMGRYAVTGNHDAYSHYLLGKDRLRQLNLPSVRRARKEFAQALDLSPNFSPALSGIAQTLNLEWLLLARAEHDLVKTAQVRARQAIELDGANADGYRELGTASLYVQDFALALDSFAQAEQIAPHHADILADHANALVHSSEPEDAKRRIDQALQLNPLPPDAYLWTAGGASFFLRDYQAALDYLQRMQDKEPALRLMAACAAMMGDRVAAERYRRGALAIHPDFRIEQWTSIMPQRGQDDLRHYAEALKRAGFQ